MYKNQREKTGILFYLKEIIYNLFLALFLALIVIILGMEVFKIGKYEVLSNSMSTVFSKGDFIFAKKQDVYSKGDIVVWTSGQINVTHRIKFMYEKFSETKAENVSVGEDNTYKEEGGDYYLCYDGKLFKDITYVIEDDGEYHYYYLTHEVFYGNVYKEQNKADKPTEICFYRDIQSTNDVTGGQLVVETKGDVVTDVDYPITNLSSIMGKVYFIGHNYSTYYSWFKANWKFILFGILDGYFIIRLLSTEIEIHKRDNKYPTNSSF